MQLPSNENLRCFQAAAKSPTFRDAARVVGLTPAAFGQRIKQLEDQLGAPLFQRTSKTLSLTREGLALLPLAEEALASAARCLAAASAGVLPPMELTIGTRYELGLSYVLPLHDEVVAAQPHLSVHYFFGGSGSELLARLIQRSIDCAVTSQRLTYPELDFIRLHREDYIFVGAPSLLDRLPLDRDEDAREHVLIDIDSSLPLFGAWRDAPDGGDRLAFKRVCRAGSIEPMRRLVLAGRGVAVLPTYFVQAELDAGTLRQILPAVQPVHDYFRLVFRRDDARRPVFAGIAETYLQAPLR